MVLEEQEVREPITTVESQEPITAVESQEPIAAVESQTANHCSGKPNRFKRINVCVRGRERETKVSCACGVVYINLYIRRQVPYKITDIL